MTRPSRHENPGQRTDEGGRSGVDTAHGSDSEIPAREAGFEALLRWPGKVAGMEIERETILQAGISFAAVLLFIAATVVIGTTFRTNGNISGTGGLAIIGAIAFFIVLMTGVGFWLAYQE
jgi:hypothetical protein